MEELVEVELDLQAVVQILGGEENVMVQPGGDVERVFKAYAEMDEENTHFSLGCTKELYYEAYGFSLQILLEGIVVNDYDVLNSAVRTDEETGAPLEIMKCLIKGDNTITVVVIKNVDFDTVFPKHFTLDSHLPAMIRKQHELNVATNGPDYLLGVTNKGKRINWPLCIRQEMSELIDSTPWKHWKDVGATEYDYKNIFMETIDIWHFLLAAYIQEVFNHFYRQNLTVDQIIDETCKYRRFQFTEFTNIVTLVLILEEHKGDTAMMNQILQQNIEQFGLAHVNTRSYSSFVLSILMIFGVHNEFNKSSNDFVAMYFAKNILNQFRKDNGYQEGTYVKIWNGEEDNVVLDRIVSGMDTSGKLDIEAFTNAVDNQLYDAYAIVPKPSGTTELK